MRSRSVRRAGLSLILGILLLLAGIIPCPSPARAYSDVTSSSSPQPPSNQPQSAAVPPRLSILLLIDVTGTMGEHNKLEQAKQAAIKAIWDSAPPQGGNAQQQGMTPVPTIPHTPGLPPVIQLKFEKYLNALEELQKQLGPDIRQWLTKAEAKEMGVLLQKMERLMQGLAFGPKSELMQRLSPLIEKMHYSVAARVNQELGGGLKYILPGKTASHPEFGGLFSLRPSDHDAIYMGAKAEEALRLHEELAKTYGDDFLRTTQTSLESSQYLLDKPAAGEAREAFERFSGPSSNLDWMRTPSGSKWIQDYVDQVGTVVDLDALDDAANVQKSCRQLSSFADDELKNLGVEIDRRSLKDLGYTLGAQSDFERQVALNRLRAGMEKGLSTATAEDSAMIFAKYGPRFRIILENSGVDISQTAYKNYIADLQAVGQKAAAGQALSQADVDVLKKFDEFTAFTRKASLDFQQAQQAAAVQAGREAQAAGDTARAAQANARAVEIGKDTQAALHNYQQLNGQRFAGNLLDDIGAKNSSLADDLRQRLQSDPWVVNEGTLEDAVKKQMAAEGRQAGAAAPAPGKAVITEGKTLWEYAKANPGHALAKFAQYGCYGWMGYEVLSLIHEGKDAEAFKTAVVYAGMEGSNYVGDLILAGKFGAGAGGWVTLSALGGFMAGNLASNWVRDSQVNDMTVQMLSSYAQDGNRTYADGGMLQAMGATGRSDDEIMSQFQAGTYGDSSVTLDANGNVTIKRKVGDRWVERGGEIPVYETQVLSKGEIIAHQRLQELFQVMRGKYLEAIDRGEVPPDDGRTQDEFSYEDRFGSIPGGQFFVPNRDKLISLQEFTFYRKLFDETWQKWSLGKNTQWSDPSIWGNNMENAFRAKWAMFRMMMDALSQGKKRDIEFQQKLKDESPENLEVLKDLLAKGFGFSLNGRKLTPEDIQKMIEDKLKARAGIVDGLKRATTRTGLSPELEKLLKEIGLDELLPDLTAGQIEFGLMPYSGSCSDQFPLLSFTQEADTIKQAILGLSAGGATPMTPALRQARYAICRYGRGDAGVIILLCDGQNDCSDSPVKAAEQIFKKDFSAPTGTQTTRRNDGPAGFSLFPALWAGQDAAAQQSTAVPAQRPAPQARPQFIRMNLNEPIPAGRQNIPITVSTVGFQVTAEQQRVLDEIARAGGGISGRADNIAQLTQAFSAAIQTAGQNTGLTGGTAFVIAAPASNRGLVIILAVLLPLIVVLFVAVFALRRRAEVPAGKAKVRASLDVVYEDGGRKTFMVTETKTTIGRAADNSLVLHDPEISGYHAEIRASSEGFVLRDLKSTNGTKVNGERITERRLFLGDEIVLGTTKLIFRS